MIVRRVEAADALIRDGQSALLLDNGTVVRLSELSTAIYALTREPVRVGVLSSSLEEAFGLPEGRSTLEATQDAVAEMVRHGILRAEVEPSAG